MRPVGSQATMCEEFVLRQVCATSWFSSNCKQPVGSHASVWDQLIFSRVMGPVGSQAKMFEQLVPDEIGNQFILTRICATN